MFIENGLIISKVFVVTFLLFCGVITSCSPPEEWGLRSKISSVRAKQRELGLEIQSYKEKHNSLPFGKEDVYPQLFHIPSGFKETLHCSDGSPFDVFQDNKERFYFAIIKPQFYLLVSPGPDKRMDITPDLLRGYSKLDPKDLSKGIYEFIYDPTNGIVSAGDIFRVIY